MISIGSGGRALRWLALLVAAWGVARADVRLHGLFTDHMVLQRGVPVPVWGWADDGEVVRVTFRGRPVSTTARDGKWMVRLPRQKAGGPFTLVVEGRNRIELQDVLVGEVWICSGQSNMEWPLSSSYQPEAAIAAATNEWIRLYTVPKLKADAPVDDVKAAWQRSAPETAKGFSAVGYFFGRDLQRALNVPVGLIHTSWGGSPAEVWIREAVLAANPEYRRDILEPYPAQVRKYQADLATWENEAEDLKKQGKEPTRGRPWPVWKPGELYNGMIAPLRPFAIQGVIWYQGESNASRAQQYRTLFPNLIQNWRDDWGQGGFPFLAVQIAPWDKGRKRALEEITMTPTESDWAELREAQWMASRAMKNVGVAVITDLGDKDDIHPARKEPVGARLALAALAMTYGRSVEYSGPVFRSLKVKKNKAILRFDHVDGGLEARGGKLRGFALCGDDGKFLWATAEIDGDTVVVTHPLIDKPQAVRYGWADYPVVNLFNKTGLPAVPFRTDDYPLTTSPKE